MNSSKTTHVTIDMTKHGLKILVTTTQEKIHFYLEDYKNAPDKSFAHGCGKTALKKKILQNIMALDKYFDHNLNEISNRPQLWNDFLEDCIVYATLSSYLSGQPLPLAKPVLN
jgi:hypothetical protein